MCVTQIYGSLSFCVTVVSYEGKVKKETRSFVAAKGNWGWITSTELLRLTDDGSKDEDTDEVADNRKQIPKTPKNFYDKSKTNRKYN